MIEYFKYKIRQLQAKYFAKKIIYQFDEDWFKNKRVAIVGGADSVLQNQLGEYIDAFDVVVRINKGVEVIASQSEYVGTRTDFLFHAFYDNANDAGRSPITIDLWKKNHVKHLVYTGNHKESDLGMYTFLNFVSKSKRKMKCTELPIQLIYKNRNAIKPYWPTNGFIAINTIFNCKPSELYITGITFFKTPHNKVYRSNDAEEFRKMFTGKPGDHFPEAEYQFIKNIYSKNKDIIKPDKTLLKIFETN